MTDVRGPGSLRVDVLGPFEVLVDGAPVGPAGARRRGLLALLALEPGAVLPVETLVDRLWGADAPPSAVNVVQTYVSAWRRVLGGRDGVLRTVGAGYQLDVGVEQCDYARFRALTAEARELAATGALDQAEQSWDQALRLWRGPALADLAGTALHDRMSQRLEDERVLVLEAWADAALRLDHEPSEVLDRLALLRASDPWRESAAALVVRAHAAAGRPADALSTYDEIRRVLRDELGADPGPVLQGLHARVLGSDPVLVRRTPPAELAPTPLPLGGTDPLFGRDADVPLLQAMLEERRLVTLTGPGGCGKTRLATEVLARYVDAGGSAWFADLGPVRDGGLVAPVVAAAVGAQAAAGADAEASLVGRLRAATGLLVLDNLEHLHDVGRLVARLHEACPHLQLLATSRHPLAIAGEQQYPVALLSVPDRGTDDPDALASFDSVRLLVDRAVAADPAFRVTPATAPAVAAIVRQLDGLPLALEIVAPWLRLHSPAELADRLSHAPLDLRGRRTDRPERQRSLRDTVDWSYQLLAPAERSLFRRLAVFAGSFSLAGARAVGGGGPDDDRGAGVADVLLSLVDAHLVQRLPSVSDQPRFRLLQTVREYAAERLHEDPDHDEVRDRFARAVGTWAVELAANSEGPESGAWLALAVAESDNLRAAIAHWGDRGAHAERLQLVADAMTVWFEAGHEQEGEALLSAALDAAGPDAPARAIALTYWAWLRSTRDRAGAAAAAAEAVALARDADDPLVEAFACQTLGDTLRDPARAEAASREVFDAARRGEGREVRYGPTAPDAVRCGASASIAATWAHRSVADAVHWQREALRLAELEGDRRITAVNAARLARLHLLQGDVGEAGLLLERARTLVSTHVTARWEDIVSLAEAELLLHLGHVDEAERQLRGLVNLATAAGRRLHSLLGFLLLADLHTAAGRIGDAADDLAQLARVPGTLDDPAAARAWEVRQARVDRLAGSPHRAAERLGAAEPLLPQDALPPERVIWLLERATSASAGQRAKWLGVLDAAETRTGVRPAPWEARRRHELAGA
ncbi:BTAD domain-containing putative transcriptional regulator [Nocardioides sp.]|uniref:BTAD domain-containing putative transcriptional regulator n=1 Tax=Nocardioides sp. TaxID=35761 RepID=UPI001A2C504F|nr:BTAD domain-containing putative transcriptional regulator [Nocardioides sp.]MBJ7356483.1 winged helix-turn-helix domain-containing protein [Nocardioides sp.]